MSFDETHQSSVITQDTAGYFYCTSMQVQYVLQLLTISFLNFCSIWNNANMISSFARSLLAVSCVGIVLVVSASAMTAPAYMSIAGRGGAQNTTIIFDAPVPEGRGLVITGLEPRSQWDYMSYISVRVGLNDTIPSYTEYNARIVQGPICNATNWVADSSSPDDGVTSVLARTTVGVWIWKCCWVRALLIPFSFLFFSKVSGTDLQYLPFSDTNIWFSGREDACVQVRSWWEDDKVSFSQCVYYRFTHTALVMAVSVPTAESWSSMDLVFLLLLAFASVPSSYWFCFPFAAIVRDVWHVAASPNLHRHITWFHNNRLPTLRILTMCRWMSTSLHQRVSLLPKHHLEHWPTVTLTAQCISHAKTSTYFTSCDFAQKYNIFFSRSRNVWVCVSVGTAI